MNEILRHHAVAHSVYIQRYAGMLSNLFDPYTERLQKELIILLARAKSTTNIRRINQIVAEYRSIQLAIYKEYNDEVLFSQWELFSSAESKWQLESLKAVIKSPSITLQAPAAAQVWAAVNTQPLIFESSGGVKLLEPFIKDWEVIQTKKVGDIIRTGFITGRTSQQITQDIAGKNGYLDNQNRKSIKTMVRTATNHLSNVARQETMDENDDIVIGYEISATLDSRTSTICRGYDNAKVYNKGLIIYATGRKQKTKYRPKPPFHPNCRTATFPILDDRYAIDDTDATRASKGVDGGGQVDSDLSYYEWLRVQGKKGAKGLEFVQDVLGKDRGRLFVKGGLSLKDFRKLSMDQLFKPITLVDMQKANPLAFELAGLS